MNRRIKAILLIMLLIFAVLPAEAKSRRVRRPYWKFISEKNGTVFYKRINTDGTEKLFISNQLLPEGVEKIVPSKKESQTENKNSPLKKPDLDLMKLNDTAETKDEPSENGDEPSQSYKAAVEEPNGNVAITRWGVKYHNFDCPDLKDKKGNQRVRKRISTTQAKKLGYEPCGKCHPPK